MSQSEFNVEESQEGYHSGSDIFNSREETKRDEGAYQYEDEEEEKEEEGNGYQGCGYKGNEEEEKYEKEEDDNYYSDDWDGGDVERPPECVDGGEGAGGPGIGHSMGGSGSRTDTSRQTNQATGKRSHSQRGNDNGDDGKQDGPPTKKRPNHDSDDANFFKCPLYILDPTRYSDCSRTARQNLSGIKYV